MSKRLRVTPIHIAPNILGYLDNHGIPHIINEHTYENLSPYDINDKIVVYKAQVNGWFLKPAERLLKSRHNTGFVVLMICLSYIEGVEQYRQGMPSNMNSKSFFINGLKRICPYLNDEDYNLGLLYKEARCGLFHNGMVDKRIIINNSFSPSIRFEEEDIRISPSKLLQDINNDFNTYLSELTIDHVLRENFDRMFSNL